MVEALPLETGTEVPRTLDEAPPPRLLGTWDQTILWTNLGVSLLLMVSGTFVLVPDPSLPALSLAAALVALVVGTLIGNVLLGLAAVPGAETGAPAMVLLRGLLGRRGSLVPTAVNIVQLLGWTTFELVVIAETASSVTHHHNLRWLFVLLAGAGAIAMAVRPLGIVRGYLKKVATWAVLVSSTYLFIQVFRQPLPAFYAGSWKGFWKGTDVVIALAVSWIPLAADYSRHSKSRRAAFIGASVGNGVGSFAYFLLGILAFAAYGIRANHADVDVLAAVVAIPAGAVALVILLVDELDEAFANLYSTVVSLQNFGPDFDRRLLAVAVGAVATVLALVFDIRNYQNFLLLIGPIFVPLFATFAVDYFLLRRGQWDTSEHAQPRWQMLIPWAAGFVAYQLINPGTVGWWQRWWVDRQHDLHFTPPTWASASLASLVVAAALALIVGKVSRPIPRTAAGSHSM